MNDYKSYENALAAASVDYAATSRNIKMAKHLGRNLIVELDDGIVELTPDEALEAFHEISPGEYFAAAIADEAPRHDVRARMARDPRVAGDRVARLSGTSLVAFGALGSVLHLAGSLDLGEGSLWFPVAVVIGATLLIRYRPRS